jgi:molecular chaperone Hsp33
MDNLIKALALNEQVRVYLVKSSEVINEAIKRHDLWPSAASVLGKTMTIGLMMGAMLKNDEALTIKINGNGPIGNIIVDTNAKGEIRGYVDNPHINFVNVNGGLNDETAIGTEGYLDVIKDAKMKDFFTSTIALTGDLAKDFTYYFMESEQTPSAVYLGIQIDVNNLAQTSGGLIFQLLPNTTEETITKLETSLTKIESVSDFLANHSLEEALKILFEDDYCIIDRMDVKFHCECNKESFSKGLITLGENELAEILNEEKHIQTVCHYCGEKYHFDEDEIKNLIKEIKK